MPQVSRGYPSSRSSQSSFSSFSTPLSYQTTMPEYPDASYEAYQAAYGYTGKSRFDTAIGTWWDGAPDYSTWRANLLDEYYNRMSAYNTWLQTGEGIRSSAESGGYNPSYFDGGAASAQSAGYQDVDGGPSGFSEMAQGISGLFQFAQAFGSLRMLTEQIAGQKLKNEAQEISNRYLDTTLSLKRDVLGFQADKKQHDLETLFYPRWSKYPELWNNGVFSPYGRGSYDLRGVDNSFEYQRQVKDLDLLDQAKALRIAQTALIHANTKEKNWFIENVNSIQREILEKQRDLLSGQLDFLPIEQKLRKAGVIAGIGVNVINAAVNVIRSFVPSIRGFGSGSSPQSPYRYPDWINGDGTGLDLGMFGSLGFE